jgi:hypothetical protein
VAPGSYLALSHMTDEAHPEAAEALFRMTKHLHWNTPLISRSRTAIARLFDGFTLVEPGLVRPAEWRLDLDNPLRLSQQDDGSDEPVLRPFPAARPEATPEPPGICAGSASRPSPEPGPLPMVGRAADPAPGSV